MCFDYDALPPDLPEAARSGGPESGVALNQQLTLTSQDGTQFAAYLARPTAPNGAGVAILPDVRGLFRFYEALAQRFAQAGIEAIAIDYFGRTAGVSVRDETFEYMPHVQQTKADQVAQ